MKVEEYLFSWKRYSKKLSAKILSPQSVGSFNAEDAKSRQVYYAHGRSGSLVDGNEVHFHWLVDEKDGVIIDARFQAFGQTALIGACEAACEMVVGKNYVQVERFTPSLIDLHLRDRSQDPAFPDETIGHLELVIVAMRQAAHQCSLDDLPKTILSPLPQDKEEGEIYPGWENFTLQEKVSVIKEVMEREIVPYVAMDGGGVEVLNLIKDREVIITYQGACNSCPSSMGATLSAIQGILRSRVHPDLVVIPEFPEV